jgi:putative membrane protein
MQRLSLFVITTALFSACAMFSADRADRSHRAAGQADDAFLKQAAMGGLAEVQLGRLAQERSSNREVSAFAKRMVEDHTKANEELKRLASKKGVTLPTSPNAKHQGARDRLAQLTGPAFDRAYMEAMVADHDHTVEDFQRASRSNEDDDVRAFASRTLPILEEHQKEARRIQGAVSRGESPVGLTDPQR